MPLLSQRHHSASLRMHHDTASVEARIGQGIGPCLCECIFPPHYTGAIGVIKPGGIAGGLAPLNVGALERKDYCRRRYKSDTPASSLPAGSAHWRRDDPRAGADALTDRCQNRCTPRSRSITLAQRHSAPASCSLHFETGHGRPHRHEKNAAPTNSVQELIFSGVRNGADTFWFTL